MGLASTIRKFFARKKSSEPAVVTHTEIVHHWHNESIEDMGFRAHALLLSAPEPTTATGKNAVVRLTNALNKARKNADNDGRFLESAIILFEKAI